MSGVILMYHRVAELLPDVHRLCTPPDRFRAQMKELAGRAVTLQELARTRQGVAVTLDDGTLDALAAAEILDEAGVPATFFVGGDRLEERHESWWDTLERIFLDGAALPPLLGDLPTRTPEERAAAHQCVRERLFPLGAAAQAQALAEIADWSGLDLSPRPSHRLLTGDELRALARRHQIGAHGRHHLHLPSLGPDEQRAELAQSRAALEALLLRPITHLAYAYGACDDAVAALARELGFTCAVTTAGRAVTDDDDPLRLPRMDAR